MQPYDAKGYKFDDWRLPPRRAGPGGYSLPLLPVGGYPAPYFLDLSRILVYVFPDRRGIQGVWRAIVRMRNLDIMDCREEKTLS